jgi:hypothetical protein
MNTAANWLLKLLSLLSGVACCAGGGYLAYLNNKDWGWFLFVGFLIIAGSMIWCGTTEDNK